jgi:hypothetical protein
MGFFLLLGVHPSYPKSPSGEAPATPVLHAKAGIMAIGTITKPTALASRADFTDANQRVRVRDVQLSSGANYTTGGETINPADVGLGKAIEQAIVCGNATTTSGTTSRTVVVLYQTGGGIKLLTQTTASAEAANNSDQSTFTARIIFRGR